MLAGGAGRTFTRTLGGTFLSPLGTESIDARKGKDTLAQQTGAGLSWQVIAGVVRFGARFGIGIALARMLSPEDFGVVGIALSSTQNLPR
jgi:hypothetical protein